MNYTDWGVVAEYEADELADNFNDEKRLRRKVTGKRGELHWTIGLLGNGLKRNQPNSWMYNPDPHPTSEEVIGSMATWQDPVTNPSDCILL